jgi:hypothetical protein
MPLIKYFVIIFSVATVHNSYTLPAITVSINLLSKEVSRWPIFEPGGDGLTAARKKVHFFSEK